MSAAASAPLPHTSPTTSQAALLVAKRVVEVPAHLVARTHRPKAAHELEPRYHGQHGGHQAALKRARHMRPFGVQAGIVKRQRRAARQVFEHRQLVGPIAGVACQM